MYADDLLLLSGSLLNLQSMLDLCSQTGKELGIKFNGAKSKCICFGKTNIVHLPDMLLDGLTLNWCSNLKYLGISITSGSHFNVDVSECRRKFFMSANSVFSKTNLVCDLVKLNILESFSLPLLLYGADSGILDDKQITVLNTCWNFAYRKIFGYFKWESVKGIMAMLHKLNIIFMINMRRIIFIKNWLLNMPTTNSLNCILRKYIDGNEFQSILHSCNIDFFATVGKIKYTFHSNFRALV